jgi:hypothetical protein
MPELQREVFTASYKDADNKIRKSRRKILHCLWSKGLVQCMVYNSLRQLLFTFVLDTTKYISGASNDDFRAALVCANSNRTMASLCLSSPGEVSQNQKAP